MKIGIYFCNCGSIVSDKVDSEVVKAQVAGQDGVAYYKTCGFMCSGAGKLELEADLKAEKPDRIVIAACSPRDHEKTFQEICGKSGVNPWMMQMVNIREQVAWVTEDKGQATRKAAVMVNGAVQRIRHHQALERTYLDVSTDVLILGAGPAGLKAALTLAEAGRQVTLVDKAPAIGGMPVRYDEVAPAMECAPCMLTPLLEEATNGPLSKKIEILTLTELEDAVGFFGNFTVTLRQKPRFVSLDTCIGCMECVAPCPVETPNEFNFGLNTRKAIDFPFMGAIPNVPYLDPKICVRWQGETCTKCLDACPVPDTVLYDQQPRILERKVGAILMAIGARLYDCSKLPGLGYKSIPDVVTNAEFERILASSGPTNGAIQMKDGRTPGTVAIVHCVGSLDHHHKDYCSGVCCTLAFKYNHRISVKNPGTKIVHLYKEVAIAGKDEARLYHHARENADARFIRYDTLDGVTVVEGANGSKTITVKTEAGTTETIAADMIILCPAIVPNPDGEKLQALLETARDRHGFFKELHGRIDAAQSTIRGIYIAGACQAPKDIQKTMNEGMASAGYILSGLVMGKKLEIDPVKASVNEERCSGCRTCIPVCPYSAISFIEDLEVARVNTVLCEGCGTCVAACPAGVMSGNHFTNEAILAEMEGILV